MHGNGRVVALLPDLGIRRAKWQTLAARPYGIKWVRRWRSKTGIASCNTVDFVRHHVLDM
jgi:hypothetical protein